MTTGGLPDDEWMISVDDHVIEPPNVWTDRLPSKYRDVGPRWVRDDQGEAWRFEDVRQPIGGAVTSGAIWPPEDRPPVFQPLSWDEIPPACYDVTARLAAMDADRVLATLVFPNLPGFAGSLFTRAKDKELALVCLRAYNDWVLDEWCTAAPGRFIGLALVPMWDGQLAAAEAERAIAKGARAISFGMAPHNFGVPSIHDADGYWDRLFAVANETGAPLCTHLGTQTNAQVDLTGVAGLMDGGAPGAPGYVGAVLLQLAGQSMLLDWLFSGIFQRHPHLTLCLSENGIGWIPAVLQAADSLVAMTRDRVTQPTDPENDPLLTEDSARDGEGGPRGTRDARRGCAAPQRALPRPRLRLLHPRSTGARARRPDRRRQRDDRDGFPAQLDVVPVLDGEGPRVARAPRRRGSLEGAPGERGARVPLRAGGASGSRRVGAMTQKTWIEATGRRCGAYT